MTSTPLLRDAEAQAELDRVGYVVVEGLAADDVDALRHAYEATHPDRLPAAWPVSGEPWTEDMAPGADFTNDLEAPFERRDAVERALAPFWARYLPAVFLDHRPLVSTFLMKWPGEVGHLPLHQDPSFVDERVSRAATLWIAIDDADTELGNGPLHVVPGSHLLAEEFRGTNTSATFLQDVGRIWPHTVPVPVRAGDAVVLDGRLVHGSPPNTSGRLRLAVCTPVAPVGQPLVHVVGIGDDRVALYGVDDAYYRRTSPMRLAMDPPVPPPGATVLPRAPRPFALEALTS